MNKGLTLIEIIIYVAILGFVATAFMTMSINLMSLKTKSVSQQDVTANLRYLSSRLNYEIKNAKAISATTATSLTLTMADNARNPTVFDLSNGNLRLGFGSSGSCPSSSPCILNSNTVTISNFIVNNYSSADNKTQNIHYSITANYLNPASRAEFDATGSVTDSIEIRSK